jgi:hypothetical protein
MPAVVKVTKLDHQIICIQTSLMITVKKDLVTNRKKKMDHLQWKMIVLLQLVGQN